MQMLVYRDKPGFDVIVVLHPDGTEEEHTVEDPCVVVRFCIKHGIFCREMRSS